MTKGILNPFLLGDFERSGKVAIHYAETLLADYMFKGKANAATLAHETAHHLCEGYYDHSYPIGRKEAREVLHLTVDDIPPNIWAPLSELMQAYDKMMEDQDIASIIETSDAFKVDHWAK
jgi:hypothetical protein